MKPTPQTAKTISTGYSFDNFKGTTVAKKAKLMSINPKLMDIMLRTMTDEGIDLIENVTLTFELKKQPNTKKSK